MPASGKGKPFIYYISEPLKSTSIMEADEALMSSGQSSKL
jgi:hypothetical protein